MHKAIIDLSINRTSKSQAGHKSTEKTVCLRHVVSICVKYSTSTANYAYFCVIGLLNRLSDFTSQ